MDRIQTPTASDIPPDRRLIAVGTIRHLDGRTITVRATETGVTGTNARAAANGASTRRRDRLTRDLHRPAVTA
ncbi:hypothetical protein OG909_24830 [Streptomyces sp. NBC_01754]|uniref:hypothetical protein n=1 Tax=Streptomyces sp. NBC_01754 TaxID=2975930 RepID=UPI002DD8DA01|nr:hypothetical protein [Streptomyces sp. NBC_01754]WSC95241.1 hypothetical protein OG909_24830 [Streptomyces sp. NBC_01754]